MLSLIEKVIFLKQVPFFADMSADDLRLLGSISEELSFDHGRRILTEGEYGDALYVVIIGLVSVQRHKSGAAGNASLELARLGPREYFGEMSLFNRAPTSADVVALIPTHVLRVRRDPLFEMIKRQPQMAFGVLEVLSQRLSRSYALLAEKSYEHHDEG
jgi:CRP-like cAMP-binding protein